MNVMQREFVNDTGSSVVISVLDQCSYSELIIEHEDYNGDGGPVHEETGSTEDILKVVDVWVEDLKGLKYLEV